MNVITGVKSKLTLASIAMLASMATQAVPISNPILSSGPSAIYLEMSPGVLAKNVAPYGPGDLSQALFGLPGNGGNVELGKFGNSTPTTLSGNFGTPDIVTLSSLTNTDWTANSNALAIAYITGAASAYNLSVDITAAVAAFLNPLATLGGLSPWQLVSDPNVSDVNLIGGHVVVGLDGFLDGSTFLNAVFNPSNDPLGPKAPAGSTASEVVRVDYLGNTKYLYGFSATPTGYSTTDGSYNGRFTIPEPTTLPLLGLGFAGLSFMRRRSNT